MKMVQENQFDFSIGLVSFDVDVVHIEPGMFAELGALAGIDPSKMISGDLLPPVWLDGLVDVAPEIVPDDQIAFAETDAPDDWIEPADLVAVDSPEALSADETVFAETDGFDFVDPSAQAAAGEAAAADVSVG